MRDDYKIKGKTKKSEVEFESEVLETLEKMERFSKLTVSELVNTAAKRFIITHKDFLSPEDRRG